MADPFFNTANNAVPQNNPNQPNIQWVQPWQANINQTQQPTINDQVKKLNDQQTQIQAKYQELKNLYQNSQLTIDQKQQVQVQMEKLSTLYTQNKQTLLTISTTISGDKEIRVDKNVAVKKQKQNKKISFKWIMLGCIILFIFLVWWLAAVFYYLIQNPNQLTSVGINPQTATQLLQTFTTVFFGLLFFASLGMLITNFYRLTTSKNKSKFGYVVGIVFWFLILIGTLLWWSQVLNILKNIQVDDFVDNNRLLKPYIQLKDATTYLESDPKLVAIAPVNIFYKLNTNLFNKQIVPTFGDVSIQQIILDCGNDKTLEMNMQKAQFIWACMYQQKWTYPLKLIVKYVNTQTAEQMSQEVEAWTLPIRTQIDINTNKWNVIFSKNEVIAGENPVKVTYDASNIFTEFQLPEYKIIWDTDWDWDADKSDLTTYTHLYTWAKLYDVNIRFPGLNDYLYTFPLRVEQSDVPVAEVSYQAIDEMQYNISAWFFGTPPDVSEYIFNILDKTTNKKIDSIASKNTDINYIFPGKWTYAIQIIFITQEGKQWIAESDNIVVWWTQFKITFDTYIKTPTTPEFKKLDKNWNIQLTEIPSILKFNITDISPSSPWLKTQVLVDGSPIISTNDTFQTTIDTNKDYIIKIIVTDPNHDIRTEKEIKVYVDKDDIVWKLLVFPDIVWVSPFTVKFDASTTTVNDPEDEIVYFSWDFGDWETKENLSQSVISHTYDYNFDEENGIFYPKVVIKTKKGRELVVWSGTIVSVKKPNISLDIDVISHPAQIANMWEKVDFSLDITGLPQDIIRDFGNENTLECNWRECVSASQIYDMPGEYTVSAKVVYNDRPTIEWTINLVIK